MKTQTVSELFTGEGQPFGGLSNEHRLADLCPLEFKSDNPWSDYAMKIFYRGGKIANWKWKSTDEKERQNQRDCFHGLLGTFNIKHEDKEAVAGWMLSEMLTEVPEHVPREEH